MSSVVRSVKVGKWSTQTVHHAQMALMPERVLGENSGTEIFMVFAPQTISANSTSFDWTVEGYFE